MDDMTDCQQQTLFESLQERKQRYELQQLDDLKIENTRLREQILREYAIEQEQPNA